jgi:condensin complex subunit 1
MNFNLEKEISEFSTDIKPDEEFTFTPYFNKVSDALAASSLNILNEDIFECFKQLIYNIPEIKDSRKLSTIYFTLTKSIQSEVEIIDSEGFDIDAFEHKQVLYYYIYLTYISIQHLVNLFEITEKDRTKRKSSDEADKKRLSSLNTILSSLLGTLCELLNEQLTTILQGEQEPIEFCDAVLKSAYSILMAKETMKEKTNRSLLVKLFCIVAKNHQQNDQVSHRLTMALPFSEHVADPIAEILSTSVKVYDNRHLLQDMLVSLISIETIGPNLAKNMSMLLIKLSELLDVDIIYYIELFQKFEFSSPTIRAATMICYGNCINSLSTSEELLNKHEENIKSLIGSLEDHLLDTYQIVRQRCFQALELIHINERSKFNFKDYRYRWTVFGLRHLEDKSSFVRKAAIGLLKAVIKRHPYTVDEGKLSWKFYWENYVNYTEVIKNFNNGIEYNAIRRNEIKDDELSELLENYENSDRYKDIFVMTLGSIPDDNSVENLPSELLEIVLKRKYCRDACIFIKLLDKSFEIAGTLLNSKGKSDAVSAIEYFTVGDAYQIESAKSGIKQMLHLIWKNGSNEDNNKVVEKLIDAYVSMFLTPPEGETEENKAIYVATSLIKLTYNCSMADLISLEKMITELSKGRKVEVSRREKEKEGHVDRYIHWITPQILKIIWHSFVKYKHFKEKRGAIIMISMLALSDYKVVHQNIELLLNYGLDLNDLNYQIASFTCIALRRTLPKKLPKNYIYPNFQSAISRLKQILLIDAADGDWYNLAEEALNTLYEIDRNSDQSATEVLKQKALSIFSETEEINVNKTASLSQFLFLLGHVGLKTIIYLERSEADFKRKKQDYENKKTEQDMELDLIGGTNEDEFTDAVQNIKEKELLYGCNSILAKFVPLLIEIIIKPKKYNNQMLQRQATLCFAKFMCLSPRFCESHLGLYLSLIDKSSDSIVRSNLVLGLGDIAVCFTNIIDENKSALYSELQDRDLSVQRTCLMTVTFLILAGQIKVKGQLSQLAKLLVHEDKGLREMSKLFFQELATKDNAIYNGFIEMLSGLNLHLDEDGSEDQPFPFDKFKEVIKFVLPFINKDRQRNLLIKKLDLRLKSCSKNEWFRYSFCLKELIKRDDGPLTKKDTESEKTRYYKEILDKINEAEKAISSPSS